MTYISFSLNGAWDMFYQKEVYESEELPMLEKSPYEPDPLVLHAVPGYWEDMTEEFKTMPFFGRLAINPQYGIQAYPLLGMAPDMALPNITGNFFYSRTFMCGDVPENGAIHFEGVQNSVSVWINGVFLGRHEGYSTPFELQIPASVLKKGENSIVLSVSNYRLKGYADRPVSGLTTRAANECTGGITGDVELRFYRSPLRDISLFVSNDCSVITANVETVGVAQMKWEIADGNVILKCGEADGDFRFDTEGLERWSPENPKLYTLKLTCGGGALLRKFGVRKLVTDGVHFKLNGNPYYLRGICEHCYFPETVHPTHDKNTYRRIIKSIKKLGFNFVRFHTYIPAEEYMQAADELGVIVHVESPNNTSVEEWREIVRFCRKHPSVAIYCCGNELEIDEKLISHLETCAEVVHENTDALFSPMSAMKGIEYGWWAPVKPIEPGVEKKPFNHHPKRLEAVGEFSDMYSSYANGYLSYFSLEADHEKLDDWSRVYNKPRVSHEICIDGTYADLSLKDRYKNWRIGKTEMFSSIEKHLESKGMLEKASLYFIHSSEWQRRIRKHCFESARLCNNLAGFDFLGPIDTHWHTFGYDVGMMNEFYELKPGETVRNVLMYNSPTVVLNDLKLKYNYYAEENVSLGIFVSHFGEKDLADATVTVRLFEGGKILKCERISGAYAKNGAVTKLCEHTLKLPKTEKPLALKLSITVSDDEVFAENEWEMYVFPRTEQTETKNMVITDTNDIEELIMLLEEGKDVLVTGKGPFASKPTSFRPALAGRTDGNLATVINDHPALVDLPHEGFCSWQFVDLLEGGEAVCFEAEGVPFDPIIEIVSSHKYVFRQAALFEFKALNGRLLVAGFHFKESDPAANWLLSQLTSYMQSDEFCPAWEVGKEQLYALARWKVKKAEANKNFAFNANDITMQQS